MCDNDSLDDMVEYELRRKELSRRQFGAIAVGTSLTMMLPLATLAQPGPGSLPTTAGPSTREDAMKSRRAVFDTPNGALRIIEEEVGEPGPGKIRVRVEAVALSRVDTFSHDGTWGVKLPASPGWAASGVVEAVGEGATEKVGQAVSLSLASSYGQDQSKGFSCERAIIPSGTAVPLLEGMKVRDGAFVGTLVSVWPLLRQGGTQPAPKSLLQIGAAGTYGSSFVQLAKALGTELVIGTASNDERLAFVRSIGADHAINYRKENVVDRVLEITGGRGVDMIIDHVAGPGLPALFRALAPWGTIMLFNREGGDAGVDLSFPAGYLPNFPAIRYYASIHYAGSSDGTEARYKEPMELILQGKFKPPISATFSLDEINEAMAALVARPTGRVLLLPQGK